MDGRQADRRQLVPCSTVVLLLKYGRLKICQHCRHCITVDSTYMHVGYKNAHWVGLFFKKPRFLQLFLAVSLCVVWLCVRRRWWVSGSECWIAWITQSAADGCQSTVWWRHWGAVHAASHRTTHRQRLLRWTTDQPQSVYHPR